MAVQAWTNIQMLLAGASVGLRAKDITLATEVAPLDVTSMSSSGNTELIGGLKTGTVNMTVMTDVGDGYEGVFLSYFNSLGAFTSITSVVAGSADGSVAYLFDQIPLSYTPWSGNVGDVAIGTISGTANTPVVRGRLMATNAARTTSGSGSAAQLGAVAAGKSIYAALHVNYGLGTSPTLDVKIQSDDNAGFTSPTDRITFTQMSDYNAEFKSTAGAITDTYWRAVWTIAGTSPQFAFAVTAGII
jgi:hypothetical protein